MSRGVAKTCHQSGFTLVEITVVLLILVLFAALLAPNIVTMRRAQQQRAAFGQVYDLLLEARNDAINQNTTTAITWDSGTSEFDIKREPQTPQTSSSAIADAAPRPLQTATTINSFEQVKALPLPPQMQAQDFRVGSDTSDAGSFALHFYPDGSSDGGGFSIAQGTNNTNVKSISVDKFGIPTSIDGALPDSSEIAWPAGTYAQKI